MSKGPSCKLEGEDVVIRLPRAEAHGLCVALAPCPCRAPKSSATTNIRNRLAKGLALLLAPKKRT